MTWLLPAMDKFVLQIAMLHCLTLLQGTHMCGVV
jgi:hypothetical protein